MVREFFYDVTFLEWDRCRGGWSKSRKKDDKDVIVNYVNRLFSCNQHFQLLL